MKAQDIVSTFIKSFSHPRDIDENRHSEAINALKGMELSARQSVIQKVIPRMIKAFVDVQDYLVHLEAVEILKNLGPEALPCIIDIFKRKNNEEEGWSAGLILSWASALHKKESTPLLIGLLQDNDEGIRNRANLYLCCMGSTETAKAIKAFFDPIRSFEQRSPSDSQAAAVANSIQDSSSERLDKEQLIKKLLWIFSLPTNFIYAGLVPAKEIGEQLYKLGGGAYMREAWGKIVKLAITQEQKARIETLNAAWAGIGGWCP